MKGRALLVNLDAWNRPGDLVIGAADLAGLMNERRPAKLWHVNRGADVETVEHVGAAWVTKTGRGVAVRCDLLAGLTVYAAMSQGQAVIAGRRQSAGLAAPASQAGTEKRSRNDRMEAGLRRGFV